MSRKEFLVCVSSLVGLVFGGVFVTSGLCYLCDVATISSQVGVRVWVLVLVLHIVVSGWMFFLFVVVAGSVWLYQGDTEKGVFMLTSGVYVFCGVSVVSVALFWWVCS